MRATRKLAARTARARRYRGAGAWAVALCLALAAACGSSDSSPADEQPDACAGATGCNGPCELGNEIGVGRFCTKGGLECAYTPSRGAPFCTQDSSDTDLAFCTRPCSTDDDCGSGAVCASDDGGGASGCFPAFCEGA